MRYVVLATLGTLIVVLLWLVNWWLTRVVLRRAATPRGQRILHQGYWRDRDAVEAARLIHESRRSR